MFNREVLYDYYIYKEGEGRKVDRELVYHGWSTSYRRFYNTCHEPNLCPKSPDKFQKSIVTVEAYNHCQHFHLTYKCND